MHLLLAQSAREQASALLGHATATRLATGAPITADFKAFIAKLAALARGSASAAPVQRATRADLLRMFATLGVPQATPKP